MPILTFVRSVSFFLSLPVSLFSNEIELTLLLIKILLPDAVLTSPTPNTFMRFIFEQRHHGGDLRLRTLSVLKFLPIQVQLAEN